MLRVLYDFSVLVLLFLPMLGLKNSKFLIVCVAEVQAIFSRSHQFINCLCLLSFYTGRVEQLWQRMQLRKLEMLCWIYSLVVKCLPTMHEALWLIAGTLFKKSGLIAMPVCTVLGNWKPGSEVDLPQLHTEFEAHLGCRSLCLKK